MYIAFSQQFLIGRDFQDIFIHVPKHTYTFILDIFNTKYVGLKKKINKHEEYIKAPANP